MTDAPRLDITGTHVTPLVLPLSPDAVAALTARDIPVPEGQQVRLLLRDATYRERKQYGIDNDVGGAARTDPMGWMARMLRRRADRDLPLAVFDELLQDMSPTDIAMLSHAYVMGVLPDPKLTAQALSQTLTGATNGLLAGLASAGLSPSSPTSTD